MKNHPITQRRRRNVLKMRSCVFVVLALALLLPAAAPLAQTGDEGDGILTKNAEGMVKIDFDDVSITAIIDSIARLTGKNFIYDDRVRGKITIISPSPVTVEEAWAVFESVLKVKGFTAVPGPADVLKIIPVRDAKESNIETVQDNRKSAMRDQFVTRLIPLAYIDADSIANTIKPLVSKDASMVVYTATNTIILTDTKANIRRLMGILDALDVPTHKEELAVIKILYADAATLGKQIADIYGATASGGTRTAASARADRSNRRSAGKRGKAAPKSVQAAKRGEVRIITESRTNSLLVMASRSQITDIRSLIRTLDVPVVGGGKIHVYYLKNADAQEMSKTLTGLISGSARAGGGGRSGQAGGGTQALRSIVTPLADGKISLNADAATNSLVIQASKEAYETLVQVIQKLDVPRPQVLVEALITEIDITDGLSLGFSFLYQGASGDFSWFSRGASAIATEGLSELLFIKTDDFRAFMRAAASDKRINIVSAPHILTMDNEPAEIRIGDNIPIITSRVSSATGATVAGLSSSVNVERKDIGVTLRVTPQISEGDTLRLEIYQELTDFNQTLTEDVAGESASEVGVALSSRKIENVVVVADGDTIVIGGLIGEVDETIENKVPWLGDIPWIGWAFKDRVLKTRKINLVVMLTPHIVRSPSDLEHQTIRKRRGFAIAAEITDRLDDVRQDMIEGRPADQGNSLAETRLASHQLRYPLARMAEIEQQQSAARLALEAQRELDIKAPHFVTRARLDDSTKAETYITEITDLGYDATLVTVDLDGDLIFELQVGKFGTRREAESTGIIMRRAMGLEPWIVEVPYQEPDSSTRQPPVNSP